MEDELRKRELAELRRSAESGNLEHLHLLLDEYMDGGELSDFKPDYTLARHFARIGIEHDSNPSRLALARILQNGYNGDPEPEKAEALYESLIGTELEMQAAFYRKNLYASATDYMEYLTSLTRKN